MNTKDPDRLYRADRLAYIANRLRTGVDITPAMLAEELHVSQRTIYRDLRSLEKGQSLKKRYSRREGRYLVESERQLPPLALTPGEAYALYTAASNPALSEGSALAKNLRAGLGKLRAALTPDPRRATEIRAASKMGYVPNLLLESIQQPYVEILRRAMGANRKVRLHYWTAQNKEQSLVVAPYEVRETPEGWYLLAALEGNSRPRLYMVGRIQGVELLSERFRFPRHFQPDSLFAEAWGQEESREQAITVLIRFTPDIATTVFENSGRHFTSMERLADGSLVCACQVNSVQELTWWILAHGAGAEVLAPPEMREAFAKETRALAAHYSLDPNGEGK